MAMVPIIANGMLRSGCGTSSAKWVAESKQENDQFGLIRPTKNATPPFSHPVLLMKVAKTNFAGCFGKEVARTVMVITTKDDKETHRKKTPTIGNDRP